MYSLVKYLFTLIGEIPLDCSRTKLISNKSDLSWLKRGIEPVEATNGAIGAEVERVGLHFGIFLQQLC